TLQQRLRTIFVRVLCRDTNTSRYVERLSATQSKRPVGDFSANALGNLSGGRKLGIRHDDDELLTAIAADKVDAAKIALEAQRDFLQHLVTYGMAPGVVDRLEPIDIDQHDRKWPLARLRPIELALQVAVEISAVIDTGQRIGDRHLDGARNTGAQAVIIALAADLRAKPRDQLQLHHRSHDIVVDGKFQPSQDVLFLALAGDENDRDEPCALQRMKL